jgi:hypothetical protein
MKKTSKLQLLPGLTPARKVKAVKQARVFKKFLLEDGYTSHSWNMIAWRSMLAGWIIAQPWFKPWSTRLVELYRRDAPYTHVDDWVHDICVELGGIVAASDC